MIILIVAMGQNRVIGADTLDGSGSELLWRSREDMQYFKDQTMGNACIMGRKTWESIPEKYRPLDGRLNIVITRNSSYSVPAGVLKAKNLQDAIHLVQKTEFSSKDIYICGGLEIYKLALEYVDQLKITQIHRVIDISERSNVRYFPELDPNEFPLLDKWPGVQSDVPISFEILGHNRK